jgi:hypothetical protein
MKLPFDEERVITAMRSPGARLAGFGVGLLALGFLVTRFVRMSPTEVALIQQQSLSKLLVALVAYCAFQVLTVLLLRPIVRGPAGSIWAAAQIVKYLPVPGSAMFGMVGRAVQEGHSARRALEFMTRHTLLMVGGGLAVGGISIGVAGQRVLAGTGIAIGLATTVLGLALAVLAAGAALVWSRRVLLALVATGSWVLLGAMMWATVGSGFGTLALVTSAFAAAWVAGLLVLPVPAGLGVREAALVFLLAPELGQEGAIAFALITRVLHVLSDAVVAIGLLGIARLRSRTRGADALEPR